MEKEERLAKIIASSGYCSRREAEKLIEQGLVAVNNKKIDTLGSKCFSTDKISINGKLISTKIASRLIAFNKSVGVICSKSDEKNRATIFDLLPPEFSNFHLVGRLDYNSEGLILLTNSPKVKRYLELPANNVERAYKVRVNGIVTEPILAKMRKSVTIDGIRYKFDDVQIEKHSTNNFWLEIKLSEGKNREIRNVLQHFNLKIAKLIRIKYGDFELKNLAKNACLELTSQTNFKKILAKCA